MNKRKIKIVILFFLILIILFSGWYMYQRLSYNKQVFHVNIYTCIAPQASLVININRNYSLEQLYLYNSEFKYLTKPLNQLISFPLIISQYRNKGAILIFKANKEQEAEIKKILKEHISSSFSPKEKQYKDANLLFYGMPGEEFLACVFHKGVFAASKNYALIEEFIDVDPENTFFTNEGYSEIIEKVKNNSPISFFIKAEQITFAVDYRTLNDTITLEGYILKNNFRNTIVDSLTLNDGLLPYKIELPDSICINHAEVSVSNNILSTRISLNKKF